MKTFIKDVEQMSERELRLELIVTRRIIDDIYKLTHGSNAVLTITATGKQNILNKIGHYCRRSMPT